jgi:hypothetical protein
MHTVSLHVRQRATDTHTCAAASCWHMEHGTAPGSASISSCGCKGREWRLHAAALPTHLLVRRGAGCTGMLAEQTVAAAAGAKVAQLLDGSSGGRLRRMR